jgi:hypothetical protein
LPFEQFFVISALEFSNAELGFNACSGLSKFRNETPNFFIFRKQNYCLGNNKLETI